MSVFEKYSEYNLKANNHLSYRNSQILGSHVLFSSVFKVKISSLDVFVQEKEKKNLLVFFQIAIANSIYFRFSGELK